jgi:hypothetical protein
MVIWCYLMYVTHVSFRVATFQVRLAIRRRLTRTASPPTMRMMQWDEEWTVATMAELVSSY